MRDYVLTLLVAAAVTYFLTPLVRRVARRAGAMKQPRDRDVHVVPIPTLGGLAMYGGLAAGLLVADQIPLFAGLADTGMITGLLLAGGLLVVIGFIDDRWGMDALPKAAGQVAAGGILVATGTSLSWLPLPGGSTYVPTPNEATVLTILIVVATINAVNFIDGLDGLAAGIVCIAAISFFLYYYTLTKVIDVSSLAAPALASAILIGMCLGFLPHNFSPATIFMGDTGSMLLGLLLAYAPISSITSVSPANLTTQINRYPVILPLLLPAALLVIPYGDLLLAIVRRTRAGRSPFAPDRKHLHHRLLDIGHSQRASVLIMYLWAAAFSGTVVWLSIQKTVQRGNSNHHGAPIFVFVVITAVAFVVLLLLSMPRLRWWQRSRLAGVADTGAGPAEVGIAGAGAAKAGGAGPVLEATVLESPAREAPGLGSPVLESTVPGSPVPGSPVLGSPVLGSTGVESTGPSGPRLAGMTAGPALSRTQPVGEAPGLGGRRGRAPAEPGVAVAPSAAGSFAAPPVAAPPVAAPPVAAPSFGMPSFAAPPSVTGQFAELPFATPPPAAGSFAAPPVAGPPVAAPPSASPRSAAAQFGGPPSAAAQFAAPPSAYPASAVPPFAAPQSATAQSAAAPFAPAPLPAPPMPAPSSSEPLIAGHARSQPPVPEATDADRSSPERSSPEPGSRAAGQDWPTRQPAGYRDQPAPRHDHTESPADRSLWQTDQATPSGTEPARSLAFWRNSSAKASGGAGLTSARPEVRRPDMRRPGMPAAPGIGPASHEVPPTGLPATGLPASGLPAAGRSVVGTPPPAVSGQQGVRGATRRSPAWGPEASPPAATDRNRTEPDQLP